jgi:hypothetical protein
MNDTRVMSGVEAVGDFDADFEEAFEFERARGDQVFECRAVERFHGDEGAAIVFTNVVDGADIGMAQRACGAGFAFEAFERSWIACEIFGEKFEGDEATEASVFGFVNNAHATAAEFFDDAVMREGLADQGRRFGHWGEILWMV